MSGMEFTISESERHHSPALVKKARPPTFRHFLGRSRRGPGFNPAAAHIVGTKFPRPRALCPVGR